MINKPKALVLAGDGINCELETAHAFSLAGFDAQIRHLNDLIADRFTQGHLLESYRVLALPGGFSFGDDLGSGRILALKIAHGLGWNLPQYADQGGMVLGVCNGFQTLIRLGVFGKNVSITHNAQGKFLNSWVKVAPQGTRSAWLRGLGTMDLPIRHGEGQVVFSKSRRAEFMGKMERQGMFCLKYEGDPNGSEEQLAGLCDPTGRILGMMPHPEAYVRWSSHPEWTANPSRVGGPGQGLALFESAFREMNQNG